MSRKKNISSGYVPVFSNLVTRQISSWFFPLIFDGIPTHFIPPKNLELLKQKGAYPYEYINSFENLTKKNCLLENISLVQQKKEKLVMMVKYQTVT